MKVGIVSYGAYIPSECILTSEVERGQQLEASGIPQSLAVEQKTVPAVDEDAATLSVAASQQALDRYHHNSNKIGALFIGSESHPYAVKPTGSIVASALGLSERLAMADLQFACKAGTQSMQIGYAYAKAGLVSAALTIGADTAQARPGDVLEFTAGAGAAAMIVGSEVVSSEIAGSGQNKHTQKQKVLVEIEATASVATDTPDFWRRPGQPYPEHAGRFSGGPAYFAHITKAAKIVMEENSVAPADLDYCVFHTPNGKFPRVVAKSLGFQPDQLAPSLVVNQIGNTYAAASLLALVSLLDQVEANKRILLVSYGSGSGSDAFLLRTTKALVEQRKNWTELLGQQISRLRPISYQQYSSRLAATQH